MIRIDASTLYTRHDLAALLKDSGVDVDHFIGRIKCRKVFRMLWLGADILEAIRTAPALGESEGAADPAPSFPVRKRGRPRKQDAAPAGGQRMIGRFTHEEIGLEAKKQKDAT
jgi:hypothetical protein